MAARTEQPPKEMEMKNITLEGEPVIWVSQPVKELSGTYIEVASNKDQINRLAAYKNQLLLILLVIFMSGAGREQRCEGTSAENLSHAPGGPEGTGGGPGTGLSNPAVMRWGR